MQHSEKLLENSGISIETLDLSEAFGRIGRLGDDDPLVVAKLEAVKDYVPAQNILADALLKRAKFGVVIDGWMKDAELVARQDCINTNFPIPNDITIRIKILKGIQCQS